MLESTQSAEHPLNSEGVWCQIFERPARDRPALFLDRDGAVVRETGYLHRAKDIRVFQELRKSSSPPTSEAFP